MLAGEPDEGAFELEIMKVLQTFLPLYNQIQEGIECHQMFERTPQGLKAVDVQGEGEGTPENMFIGADQLSKEERKQLFWKTTCSSSTCDRTNTLLRTFAEVSEKNVRLLHKGVKVVNIYKVRGYMPLEGLEKDFVFDYSVAKEKLGNRPHSMRLYPVLSEYLDLYTRQHIPSEMECDKVVKEAQTKAIAKARGVGTDDICCHFWVVLTLENGTMLHIDAVGPIYDCFEYEEETGVPLVIRETAELMLEEPKGELKSLYPDAVLMTNKCLDGTKAELPEWRLFDSFDVYPAEAMFLDQFLGRNILTGAQNEYLAKEKNSKTTIINLVIIMLLGDRLMEAQEDIPVELYNLKNRKFNQAQGKITRGINTKEYIKLDPFYEDALECRLPVTLPSGKTILVKHENIMLLPKVKSQFLLWRQIDKKMGWKHRLCNCVDWKRGLYTRIGLNYPVYTCDSDCDHEGETDCPACQDGRREPGFRSHLYGF